MTIFLSLTTITAITTTTPNDNNDADAAADGSELGFATVHRRDFSNVQTCPQLTLRKCSVVVLSHQTPSSSPSPTISTADRLLDRMIALVDHRIPELEQHQHQEKAPRGMSTQTTTTTTTTTTGEDRRSTTATGASPYGYCLP